MCAPTSTGCAGPPSLVLAAAEGQVLGGHSPGNGEPAAVLHPSSWAGGPEGTTSAIRSSSLQPQGPVIPIFCLEGVKEKSSPPKQLILQQGKTWLENGRGAAGVPQGESHRPCIRSRFSPFVLRKGPSWSLSLPSAATWQKVPSSVPCPRYGGSRGHS